MITNQIRRRALLSVYWPSLSKVGGHASWMMRSFKCNVLTGWTLKLSAGQWRASLTDHIINQLDEVFLIIFWFLCYIFLFFAWSSLHMCFRKTCKKAFAVYSFNTYLENDRNLYCSSKKTKTLKGESAVKSSFHAVLTSACPKQSNS